MVNNRGPALEWVISDESVEVEGADLGDLGDGEGSISMLAIRLEGVHPACSTPGRTRVLWGGKVRRGPSVDAASTGADLASSVDDERSRRGVDANHLPAEPAEGLNEIGESRVVKTSNTDLKDVVD